MRAILTYHSIDASGSAISLDETTLAAHVAWLSSGVVEVVPLDRILASPTSKHALAITFDDGFANFAELAWPLFARARLPVTLFVATQRVGTNNAWDGSDYPGIPTLPLLGWDALKRLRGEGLALGSHSRTHAHLTELDDAALDEELTGSADELERATGERPRHFCYPYGDQDERVIAAARKRYELACTTELAVVAEPADALRLPRLDAFYYRAPGRLEAFGTPAFRRHLWLRATARRLRASLKVANPGRR